MKEKIKKIVWKVHLLQKDPDQATTQITQAFLSLLKGMEVSNIQSRIQHPGEYNQAIQDIKDKVKG